MRRGGFLFLLALLPLGCEAPGGSSAAGARSATPGGGSAAGGRSARPSGFSNAEVRSVADMTSRVREKAEGGDAEAQYDLAAMYFQGEGVPQDDVLAAQWFRKAAEQGRAAAQFYLGEMYHQGRGMSQDDIQAATWYGKAAEQGHAFAQADLGKLSYDGLGVPADTVEAYKWETLAAERASGDEGLKKFALMVKEGMAGVMTKEQIAEAETRVREWESVRQAMEDRIREVAFKAFSGKGGESSYSVTVEGGPPSTALLAWLRRDPRFSVPSTQEDKQSPAGSPAHGPVISIGPVEWLSERKARIHVGVYKGPLDAFAETFVVVRDDAGPWTATVVGTVVS